MKRVPNLINRLPIGIKLGLGFVIVLFINLIISINILSAINSEKKSLAEFSRISNNSAVVLTINKNISEIQRNTLVYGQTGSSSILEKIKDTIGLLQIDLLTVLNNTEDVDSKEYVNEMIQVLKRYEENILTLSDRYEYRQKLVRIKLPTIESKGYKYLKEQIEEARSLHQSGNLLILQEMMQYWLEVNMDAYRFLELKKYSFRKQAKQKMNMVRDLSSKLTNKNGIIAKTEKLVIDFNQTFDKSVQANRIYLSLVNVVMAGEATEFTILANELRQFKLKRLRKISELSKRESIERRNYILLTLILSVPLILLIAWFYRANISNQIQDIAQTFKSFIDGDFSQDVPGLDRGDEIGQLAKAANIFKIMSYEMKKAKDEALSLAKSKSEFLANMSHEIRTPMNGIIGMVSLLKKTELTEEQNKLLETVDSCGENLVTILNDVLDYSKVESGKIKLEKREFDLKKCMDEINYLFTNNARDKKITLSCEIANAQIPPTIIGDETRIKQIIINLVSNAIKFTSQGGVAVTVSGKPIAKGFFDFEISIKDTGIGINKESQSLLFNAFAQADTSITRKFGGTGLGLSISLQLANLMNGEIKVESEEGVGSEFIFKVKLPVSEKTVTKTKNILKYNFKTANLSVLLVEDNLINVQVVKLMLKKIGIECDVAENGQIAVDAVKEKKYQIIFMDMQMPVLDGISATEIIKKLKNGKESAIIAMTANVFKEDEEKCYAAGMVGFIPKPVDIVNLSEHILKICEEESF